EPGKAQYTLCCDEETGGVVDDLIAYHRSDEEIFLVPNAANTAEVVRRLTAQAPADVEVVNLHETYAVLAVQGPRSGEVLDAVGLPSDMDYMSFVDTAWQGTAVSVCRTGYTGEHGYELILPAEAAENLWDAVLATPAAPQPAGLGARDTLRTEMGYPLHGQDLSPEITPVQARVGWAVGWRKPAFWGRDVLVAERESGPRRRLLGLRALARGIPRPGMTVTDADGEQIGTVTTGTFSPTLRQGIGLALLDADVAEGTEVAVDIRKRREPFTVVRPPFVEVSPKE
ncbi:MAG TPA: glycine cleavage system aminomethyltransferase GcvT, partial [Actinopolymorphaceae bacterium]